MMTGVITEEDGERSVLHFDVPVSAPEDTILDTWRTLGMRGTGSHDVKIDGLFIPDDKIPMRRKAGEWHPAFYVIATIAFPLIYSVYLGVAQSARDIAIDNAKKRPESHRTQSIAGRTLRLWHLSPGADMERNGRATCQVAGKSRFCHA